MDDLVISHTLIRQQGRDNLCINRGAVCMSRPGTLSEYLAVPTRCAIPFLDVDENTVLMLRGGNPVGGLGMPNAWHD